mmetsp:Transcript_113490/g.321139  ORF Transcript_113490/g.321139 Transcript_113490/m.321139 type:complete len:313 (+) Transcript_113490:241-1179(+)
MGTAGSLAGSTSVGAACFAAASSPACSSSSCSMAGGSRSFNCWKACSGPSRNASSCRMVSSFASETFFMSGKKAATAFDASFAATLPSASAFRASASAAWLVESFSLASSTAFCNSTTAFARSATPGSPSVKILACFEIASVSASLNCLTTTLSKTVRASGHFFKVIWSVANNVVSKPSSMPVFFRMFNFETVPAVTSSGSNTSLKVNSKDSILHFASLKLASPRSCSRALSPSFDFASLRLAASTSTAAFAVDTVAASSDNRFSASARAFSRATLSATAPSNFACAASMDCFKTLSVDARMSPAMSTTAAW